MRDRRSQAIEHLMRRGYLIVLILPVIVLFGVGLSACGGASSTPGDSSNNPQHLEGDGDYDYPGDNDNDSSGLDEDNDTDGYNSRKNNDGGYYDNDDYRVRTFGHASSAAEQRAVTALITRYYAAAARGDSAAACSLLYTPLAESVSEDYGQAGPIYLRGAKTCRAVMSLLFKHFYSQLRAQVDVTGVRVEGRVARVLLGSRTMPAGVLTVERVGGGWRVDGLLGSPLP
jgi:hypothetical protein